MNTPIDMPSSWLGELEQAAQQREDEIVRLVLQQPDYPPLPACPQCDSEPAEIKQWVEDPAFEVDGTYVQTGFKPCGHLFRTRAN
ncbi:hypothetical protein [Streptomyces sp. NPDC048272]|uniref:hypothetical protein n=1 Tax=Streptomyces sp. NPDC048272 TaxID=3154616 RepID=UPI003420AD5C